MTPKLPYDFDLHWDVKNMTDVEQIAGGEPHCSSATPADLIEMFKSHDMDVPDCLAIIGRGVTIIKQSDGGIDTSGMGGVVEKYNYDTGKYEISFEPPWCGWYTREEFVIDDGEEEIPPEEMKALIICHAKDLVGAFLYYDRKNDEELCLYDIEQAVKDGVITMSEITKTFTTEFNKAITKAIKEL